MREIIFRGKRIYNNEWFYGNLITGANGENYIIEKQYFSEDGHHLVCDSDFPVFTMQETIGQYTGLKDKNGTKIFEGDIIALSNDKVKGEIIFNEKLSAFQLRYLGHLGIEFDPKFLGEWITCYGIIGNIHDNPELLKLD